MQMSVTCGAACEHSGNCVLPSVTRTLELFQAAPRCKTPRGLPDSAISACAALTWRAALRTQASFPISAWGRGLPVEAESPAPQHPWGVMVTPGRPQLIVSSLGETAGGDGADKKSRFRLTQFWVKGPPPDFSHLPPTRHLWGLTHFPPGLGETEVSC